MTLSHWSFFSQLRLGFFLKIAAHFPALSILTILLKKCQTKSFEDMKILINAHVQNHLIEARRVCPGPRTPYILLQKI